MTPIRLAILLALAVAACGESVDPAGLPSIEGYESWPSWTTDNPVGGHGDSVRRIFVNDVGRSYAHSGRYHPGTVLVKEIHDRRSDGSAGDLRYIAIMRKVGEEDDPARIDTDAPVDGGWVFTQLEAKGREEKYLDLCWATCHVQASWDGAFFDYGE